MSSESSFDEFESNHESECFPRCEYCTRFKASSAFKMKNPDFWGTYFRSTARGGDSDRLSKVYQSSNTPAKKSKVYNNELINKMDASASKSGSFYSPWHHEEYNSIFSNCSNSMNFQRCSSSLYDSLLKYKNYLISFICTEMNSYFTEVKDYLGLELTVYHCNDYPCLMVMIPKFNEVRGESSSLYSIACATFIALCNEAARTWRVPIEIVMRSSFGHNLPSVAETSKSFRINVGIVPLIYCRLIVESLKKLNMLFLRPFLCGELKLTMSHEDIDILNDKIKEYNDCKRKENSTCQTVELWTLDESIFAVLCKVGDSRGSKISYQVTRKNKYLDLLANYVSDELLIENSKWNLSVPFTKFLSCLDFKIYVNKQNHKNPKATFFAPLADYVRKLDDFVTIDGENFEVDDDEFWQIISMMTTAYNELAVNSLSESVCNHNLYGLYSKLELSNLNFARNSSCTNVKDGFGSDSECESDEPHLYSKKITVATGIRAINVAHVVALYCIKQWKRKAKTDTSYMYYETSHAIQCVSDVTSVLLANDEVITESATIKYIDLNHCATSGSMFVHLEDIRLSQFDVVILDYTSAQTTKIKRAIDIFIEQVPVILLINSGLKNEQLGADTNPYGTLRIVTNHLSVLQELYFVVQNSVAIEKLPKHLHCIRKAYKSVGAVVTNDAIFGENSHYAKKDSIIDETGIMCILSSDEFINVLKYMNNEEYREMALMFLNAGLHEAFKTFSRHGYIDKLTDAVVDMCELANKFCLSDAINTFTITRLLHLLDLLDSQFESVHHLLENYKNNIVEVMNLIDDFYSTISFDIVENFINETDTDIEDVIDCYRKDSHIVESIVKFCHEMGTNLVFLNHDFKSLFNILYDKKFKRGIHNPSNSILWPEEFEDQNNIKWKVSNDFSESSNGTDSPPFMMDCLSEGSSLNSLDDNFSCEEELHQIYGENFWASVPEGFSGESCDED